MSSRHKGSIPATEQIGDATVVNISDRDVSDEETAQQLGEELSRIAAASGGRRLLINLGNINHLTGLSLNQLVAVHKKLRSVGVQLILCNVTPPVLEILQYSKHNKIFTIERIADSVPGNGASLPRSKQGHAALSAPAPASKLGDVALYDPNPLRAAELLTSLEADLCVAHFSDIQTLDRYCENARPVAVAVAVALESAASPGGNSPHLDSSLLEFIRARTPTAHRWVHQYHSSTNRGLLPGPGSRRQASRQRGIGVFCRGLTRRARSPGGRPACSEGGTGRDYDAVRQARHSRPKSGTPGGLPAGAQSQPVQRPSGLCWWARRERGSSVWRKPSTRWMSAAKTNHFSP